MSMNGSVTISDADEIEVGGVACTFKNCDWVGQKLGSHLRSHRTEKCPHCGEEFNAMGIGSHKIKCQDIQMAKSDDNIEEMEETSHSMTEALSILFPEGIPPQKYEMLSEWMEMTKELVRE